MFIRLSLLIATAALLVLTACRAQPADETENEEESLIEEAADPDAGETETGTETAAVAEDEGSGDEVAEGSGEAEPPIQQAGFEQRPDMNQNFQLRPVQMRVPENRIQLPSAVNNPTARPSLNVPNLRSPTSPGE